MPFRDLDELLGSPAKELPIRGKLYAFPDRISAASGLVLLRVSQRAKADPAAAQADPQAIAGDLLDPAGWEALQAEVLGRSPEDLVAEGLNGDEVTHVFRTLVAWHVYGRENAEAAWESLGNPQGPTNRTERRSKAAAPSARRASPASSKTRASASKARAGRTS